MPAALETLVNGWSERFGIVAEYKATQTNGLHVSANAAAHLYSLVQEALHNVVKHAQPARVTVSLARHAGRAVLVIEDDGRGFDPGVMRSSAAGVGLATMRERAALAGGECEIESSPARGTTIVVRVPLEAGVSSEQ